MAREEKIMDLIQENGYTLDISQAPDGDWWWTSYPKLKTPQGPYDDSYTAAEAAKAWARNMPKQNWK